jgi:hypothetical protein
MAFPALDMSVEPQVEGFFKPMLKVPVNGL